MTSLVSAWVRGNGQSKFAECGNFFKGGVGGYFLKIGISSPIRVQMGRELVRLIDLIHLNMFSIHIVHWKKFFMDQVWAVHLQKTPKNRLFSRFIRVLCRDVRIHVSGTGYSIH